MKTSYYGLICRHCGAGYPVGVESLRETKYLFNLSPFVLDCVRCGIIDQYEKYVYWLGEEHYTEAQMAGARLRTRRASKLFGVY